MTFMMFYSSLVPGLCCLIIWLNGTVLMLDSHDLYDVFFFSCFRAQLFNHMAEWHSFNVGQPDNLGESQCTPTEMGNI